MALAISSALLASAAAHAQITHGPYLQNVRVDRMTIVWEGAPLTNPYVGYGLTATDELTQDARRPSRRRLTTCGPPTTRDSSA